MGEGNVFSLFTSGGGGVPISHNALQHYPECHGADTWGGGVPGQVQLGGVPISHNALQHYPEFHGADTWGGHPTRSSWRGTLPGQDGGVPPARMGERGYPAGGVPRYGTPPQGNPPPGQVRTGGSTQLGQQKEY